MITVTVITVNLTVVNGYQLLLTVDSCELAILSTLDKWMGSVDEGEFVGTLAYSYTVPHQRLLEELASIGCSINVIRWFQSYLSGRLQRVTGRAETTVWKNVTRGVPQGSSIFPLLFNIFVRKLPDANCSETTQFADDITDSESDIRAGA